MSADTSPLQSSTAAATGSSPATEAATGMENAQLPPQELAVSPAPAARRRGRAVQADSKLPAARRPSRSAKAAAADTPETTAPAIPAGAGDVSVAASEATSTARTGAAAELAPEPPRVGKKKAAQRPLAEEDGSRKDRQDKPEKVVRDSFSMPAGEHRRIKALREALGKAGRLSSKSEVLRAGLNLLAGREIGELVALLDALPVVVKGKRGKKH